MSAALSKEVCEYLRICGMPRKRIEKCNMDTRMFHDLNLYGDIAESYMETLRDYYGVDMDDFEFEKFFPSEFFGKNSASSILIWFLPFASEVIRRRRKYLPLTLEIVDKVIRTKRWVATV